MNYTDIYSSFWEIAWTKKCDDTEGEEEEEEESASSIKFSATLNKAHLKAKQNFNSDGKTVVSFHQMAPPVRGNTHPITAYYSVYQPRKDERLSRPAWLVTYRNKVPPPGVEPVHVTHSSTNRARRRVTSLIRPTPLPLRHAANTSSSTENKLIAHETTNYKPYWWSFFLENYHSFMATTWGKTSHNYHTL